MGLLRQYQSEIYGNYRLAYVTYGVVAGLLIAAVLLFHRILFPSNPPLSPENYIIDIVPAVAIFAASYRYRSTLPNRQVMIKELMLLGIGMGIVASVVYGLLLWVICSVVFPDLVGVFIDHRLSLMPPATESAEAALAVDSTRQASAGDWAFIGGFRLFVMSILITFFSSIILRTQKAPVRIKK